MMKQGNLCEINVNVMQGSFLLVNVTSANYLDHVFYVSLFEKQVDHLNIDIVSESRPWLASFQTSAALRRSG